MKKNFNKGESHQRFSLRKLSIGVASVLIGSTFMVLSSEQVHADETNVVDASQKLDNNASTTSNENSNTENVTNNEKNVTTSDADVKNNVVNEPKAAVKDSQVTDQDYLNALGFGKMELSDQQLAKLGLTRDTYNNNGVKYKAKGYLDIYFKDGNKLQINLQPPHADNGSMLDPNVVYENIIKANNTNWEQIQNVGLGEADFDYTAYYVPYIEGGIVYANQGQPLTEEDAWRSIPSDSKDGVTNVVWDKNISSQVDVNKAGTYNGANTVTYRNGMSVSDGVKVVIVDLKGKTVYNSVGDTITTDLPNLVTGQPAGSTDYHWVDGKVPETNKVGESTGVISVTYPDGGKGTATVTIVTSNPTWVTPKTPVNTVPDPSSVINLNPGNEDMVPGTKINWVTPPDVSKPGITTGTVVVTYPDGTTKIITGTIDVYTPNTPDQPTTPTTPTTPETPSVPEPNDNPSNPDNDGDVRPLAPDEPTKPEGNKSNNNRGNNSVRPLATHTSADNKRSLATANKVVNTLPQTGAKKTNGFVAAIGAAVAAVGALFGLASRKKRY